MKPASSDLIALLLTGSFVSADIYTLILSDASVLRYTSADIDIKASIDIFSYADVFALADIFGTVSYVSGGPLIDDPESRALGHWKVGLDVDTWQVRVIPRARDPITGAAFPDKIGVLPWLAAAAGGALDGATVTVERAFAAAWPTPWTPSLIITTIPIVIFKGRMAAVDVGRSYAILNVNDFREILNISMPRNLYQAGCRFALFDDSCSLSAAAFAVAGTVLTVDGAVITAALVQASGYFDLGQIVMTSGDNDGFQRLVRSWDLATNTLRMVAPFFFDVVPGDTFTIYPGCDKQLTTCTNRFANQLNFGGMPYIPAPESAV